MRNEDLADLADLLRVFCETYPSDTEAMQVSERVAEIFKNQTGSNSVRPYLINRRNAGRKPKITAEQKQEIKQMYSDGMKLQEIATETGLAIGSVYNVLHPMARK